MTTDQTTTDLGGVVVVLDAPAHKDRHLVQTVRGCRLSSLEADTLGEFVDALDSQAGHVGVIAFERLWPQPEAKLRRIRDRIPGATLIGVLTAGRPRRLLGERLAAAGLFDHCVDRTTPPSVLRPTLSHAFAESAFERAVAPGTSDAAPAMAQFAGTAATAFAAQRTVVGVVKELKARLAAALDFDLAMLMPLGSGAPQLFVMQTRALPFDTGWTAALAVTNTVAEITETPLAIGQLDIVSDLTVGTLADTDSDDRDCLRRVIPLVVGGEPVAVLSIDIATPSTHCAAAMARLGLLSRRLALALEALRLDRESRAAQKADLLTGASNLRYLDGALASEWARAIRHGHHLSAVIVDIDDFKLLNDNHGHLLGDDVLRGLSQLLRAEARATDHVVRYGGHQFLLLLPETRPSDAGALLDRIAARVRAGDLNLESADPVDVTFSAGIASPQMCDATTAPELVELSREAARRARDAGTGRVEIVTREARRKRSSWARPTQERRRHRRRTSTSPVRFLRLPELTSRSTEMTTVDSSPGGMAVVTADDDVTVGEYAVVHMEDRGKPLLSRVAWVHPDGPGSYGVGLKFVSAWELAATPTREGWNSAKAVVLCPEEPVRDVCCRVLEAARCEPVVLRSNTDELTEDTRVVIIDGSVIASALGLQVCEFAARCGAHVIALSGRSKPLSGMEAFVRGFSNHTLECSDDLEDALAVTMHKLRRGHYFGLDQYLLWGETTRRWNITERSEKADVIAGVMSLGEEVGCHPRVADLLVSGLDEMLTTALLHRGHRGGRQTVQVECGSDGRMFAVSVRDSFGTAAADSIRAALREGQSGRSRSQRALGLGIMTRGLSRLAFNILPGERTEVVGAVDLRRSLRRQRIQRADIGLFVHQRRRTVDDLD